MITKHSNQRPRGSDRRRPPADETVLHTDKLQIERKTFILTLKENPRGRFLRITEDVGGRRDSIIVPSTGLKDFANALGGVIANCPDDARPTDDDKPLEA